MFPSSSYTFLFSPNPLCFHYSSHPFLCTPSAPPHFFMCTLYFSLSFMYFPSSTLPFLFMPSSLFPFCTPIPVYDPPFLYNSSSYLLFLCFMSSSLSFLRFPSRALLFLVPFSSSLVFPSPKGKNQVLTMSKHLSHFSF